ncbi:cohesin domain-containing protein [Silvibacterium dinghuense]|uniref:Type II and III secretion system protein n=1 Tax=Silvibacterium dinghuense TaxID=1560006 RepID=A0A4Q1SHK5_9BACT|nr:cohesin domain-containing protein [Silvibacterium dinghuense]RXS96869.1 type II and III secretion system protein [Silvibacterium dinghuense]GGG94320.1 hypothetical protein GCM10011586_06490 [Silvibacterium dinghuense]
MNQRIAKWTLAAGFVLVLVFSSAAAHAQSAGKLYKQGQVAEEKDDIEGAFNDYLAAFQKDPKDERYKLSYERLKVPVGSLHVKRGEALRAQGDTTGAVTEFLRALQIDSSNELAQQDLEAVREKVNNIPGLPETPKARAEGTELHDLGGPIRLKPLSSEPLTLHSVEDSKIIYQTIGKLAGINILFDPDYVSKRVQVDIANVNLYDALRIVGISTNTFWRPITDNTIFVAANTSSKRAELEEEAIQTFYLTNVTQQNDFNDVQTALRNIFQQGQNGAKLFGVASQNAIVMRGTPDELLLAQKLIDDLDRAKPEVVVDVAVLEVSRNYEKTIGIQLPQTASVSFQASNYNSTDTSTSSTTTTTTSSTSSSDGLTLNSLAHLNGTNFAVTIGSATANLLLTDSHTRILQNPRIRASDGQEASLKIGEKLPVATGSYQTGAATAIVSSLVNTQFQYLDIGVNITVKPTVHYDRDVSMKIKIEVSSQNGTENLGGVNEPIITQRTAEQTVRLKEGEANILGGILQKQTSTSLSGYPGLAQLPILKYIFGSNDKTIQDDEIVFLLIPHVVRATMLDQDNLREVDSGTSKSFELRHVNNDGAAPAAAPAPVSGQPAPGQKFGTVTTPAGAPATAAAAAEQAIAGMQQEATAAPPAQPVKLGLTPEIQPQKIGSTFQVAVTLAGGTDVFSVPMQLQYDQTKLNLINVDLADPARGMNFLGQDGQAVALVHRDDGAGNVAISASRPPGTKGVSGSGTVFVLTFQAKAAGDAPIVVTRPLVRNSAQQAMPATGARALVQVQP